MPGWRVGWWVLDRGQRNASVAQLPPPPSCRRHSRQASTANKNPRSMDGRHGNNRSSSSPDEIERLNLTPLLRAAGGGSVSPSGRRPVYALERGRSGPVSSEERRPRLRPRPQRAPAVRIGGASIGPVEMEVRLPPESLHHGRIRGHVGVRGYPLHRRGARRHGRR